MKHFRFLCLLGFLLYGVTSLSAQSQNSYIIQLAESSDLHAIDAYFKQHNIHAEIHLVAMSIRAYELTLVHTPTRKSKGWTPLLNNCPGIIAYQPNRSYERRRITPNDPKFSEQWYLDMIHMPEAWQLATGMIDSGYFEPVIGVLEAGYDFSRPDLQGILYTNPGEIPGNGIDDDNNGYIDDVHGWNFDSEDGNHYIDYTYHGDAVVSVMAALGNNGIGVAGINWQGKVLPLTLEARNTDAETIKAYEYFYQMRKTFNETNGEKGAFIVATNSSFGLDGYYEEDAPLFCEMFDKMGSVGILSVGATSNQDVNVDINGDLPSDCSSLDLIIVNSIDRDRENNYSGRGIENIDLAAPAEKILVVSKPGEYIEDSGTSFAAPQISGVISLAYSLGLDSMQRAIETNPLEVSAAIRTCLLENTTSAPDLIDENATGGYLNALATLECVYARYYIPETDQPIAIQKLYPNATQMDLFIDYAVKTTDKPIQVLIFDMIGKLIKEDTIDPITDHPAKISVHQLPAGVYAITLVQNGIATTQQFVKM
ncbi:S8 family peptidase [Membranicola marinus]|uniref:S8 family peptidase n=1 Tax=Membranihabitans marinus TaxID=1227546 RepID=A0A953HSF1_9BACT|nr:S8 family peptidase [Membranihabitans marinus]MBY5957411.1 S8 family peptidase [Membranihabitans marinus]